MPCTIELGETAGDIGYSFVTCPVTAIRPTLSAFCSVNHNALSVPDVMPVGDALAVGILISASDAHGSVTLTRPMLLVPGDRFVLCTTASMAQTQRADRLEEQKARLAKRKIKLVPWDACALDLMLKEHPELVDDFFEGFARGARANVHIATMYGRSNHHKVEALFKAFARALRVACSRDKQLGEMLPSTKGLL